MVEMRLYVEGGGDSKTLRTACRQGFSEFLTKAGFKGRMPRIVSCGGRRAAYDDFCTALNQKIPAMLLVDSEAPYVLASPWEHLSQRTGDKWSKPSGATDEQCHLMVECMETWFLADKETLKSFFGQGYKASALPANSQPIETVAKQTVYDALKNATKDCKTKAEYGKGEHSFLLLAKIDPMKVAAASPEAKRFVADLKTAMRL